MTELKGRFFRSATSLFRLLRLVGLNPSRKTQLWGGICFLIIFQAGTYIFIERSIPHLNGFFRSLNDMIPVLDRSARLVSTCVVFLSLVFKLHKTMEVYCQLLEPVDNQLRRPDLKSIRFTSIIGVVWILFVCNCQVVCAMYWELVGRSSKPLVFWLEIVQQFIRVESVAVFDISVVIFWVSGQLVVTLYQQLATEISLDVSPMNEFHRFALLHPQLSLAATFLCKEFALILLINCIHASSCLLFFFDAMMSEMRNIGQEVLVVWDLVTIAGSVVRLWMICHTADRIRHAALFSIPSVRRLRDHRSLEIVQTSQRNRMTLVLVEITRTLPNFRLFGLINLSKELLVGVLETTLAYILMLAEFKS